MKLRIQAVNFDLSAQLESYVNKKVDKLEKFLDEVQSIDVFLKVIKPETAANKEVEIRVFIPNGELFAAKTCDTFEEAFDSAIDAVKKQMNKHKQKLDKK